MAGRFDRLLSINPEPIKLVPAAQRDVWFKQPGWRCQHEDGRGRCRSHDTVTRWNAVERQAESFCLKHLPSE